MKAAINAFPKPWLNPFTKALIQNKPFEDVRTDQRQCKKIPTETVPDEQVAITHVDIYTLYFQVKMRGIKYTGQEEQSGGGGETGWSGSTFAMDFRLVTASGMITVCIYACVCICAHV